MRKVRPFALLVAAALSLGCSASVTLSGRLLQAPEKAAGDEAAQLALDQRLLEVMGGDTARAEAALVALGVEPREAGRRVLAALQAAQAGRTPREEGK
jgi:hypothetical protein